MKNTLVTLALLIACIFAASYLIHLDPWRDNTPQVSSSSSEIASSMKGDSLHISSQKPADSSYSSKDLPSSCSSESLSSSPASPLFRSVSISFEGKGCTSPRGRVLVAKDGTLTVLAQGKVDRIEIEGKALEATCNVIFRNIKKDRRLNVVFGENGLECNSNLVCF